MNRGLKILLTVHAVITLAAGIVLIAAPGAIPGTVGIRLGAGQFLLSYFLGAAELGMAYLSFFAGKVRDTPALRVIVTTFIVFHAATGLLELYALFQGISTGIIGNIVLRILITALFYYYGIRKTKETAV